MLSDIYYEAPATCILTQGSNLLAVPSRFPSGSDSVRPYYSGEKPYRNRTGLPERISYDPFCCCSNASVISFSVFTTFFLLLFSHTLLSHFLYLDFIIAHSFFQIKAFPLIIILFGAFFPGHSVKSQHKHHSFYHGSNGKCPPDSQKSEGGSA